MDIFTVASNANFFIGLALALLSTVFIGTSFIFKKLALRRSATHGSRAGDGSLNYLREWMWWMGFLLMGIGELANFIAYAFAPATLITPLGALSVLISTLLSAKFLNEHLNLLGYVGCFICLFGTTLIVVYAPKEQNVNSLKEMWARAVDPSFIIYTLFVLCLCTVLIVVIGPRYGKTNPVIFTLISGSMGSLSVIACKGVGVGIKEAFTVDFRATFSFWFFWFLIVWLILSISLQVYYLNRALDLFNTGLVTPILYVFFTGLVIVASAILFHEWNSLNWKCYVGLVFGLICTVVGIFMMHIFKKANVNLDGSRNYLPTTHTFDKKSSNSRYPRSKKKYRHALTKPDFIGSSVNYDPLSLEYLIDNVNTDSDIDYPDCNNVIFKSDCENDVVSLTKLNSNTHKNDNQNGGL